MFGERGVVCGIIVLEDFLVLVYLKLWYLNNMY